MLLNKISITDLTEQVLLSETGPAPASRAFNLVIKPIGPICNLDCDYCFYLDKEKFYPARHSFRMSDQTLEALIAQYIAAQPMGASAVHFAWQGGEPTLMGVDFFEKVVSLQQKYQREGMSITNALQTNGTLLDDRWGVFLAKHRFLVGISVDGPMKLHDKLRKTKTGQGSFNQVRRGVKILQQYQVEHNFLCVINHHNSQQPEKVYKALKQLGAEHIQFIPIVEHNHFEEGQGRLKVSKNSVQPEQFGRFLAAVFKVWHAQDIGRVFVRHFEEVLAKILRQGASMCIHAEQCGTNLAVEHDGTVYSCDHYVFPRFNIGNIKQTPLPELVDGTFQQNFGRAKKEGLVEECLSCDFLGLCHGGCPVHRIQPSKEQSRGGKKHLNYLCSGYKYFYRTTKQDMLSLARSLV